MTVTIPAREPQTLLREQQLGVRAWQADLALRLERDPSTAGDREAQMDARRTIAGLQRARSASKALLARRARGLEPDVHGPRAVVVHRNEWLRARLADELEARGVHVVGAGADGAAALAMAVVEQPDLLLVEDRLPWVSPLDVVADVSHFAPHTVVAVLAEDTAETAELVAVGAAAVFSRAVHPEDVSESCMDLLVTGALGLPA